MHRQVVWILAGILLLGCWGCGKREVAKVEVYEVVSDGPSDNAKLSEADIQNLVVTLNKRLYLGGRRMGQARLRDDGRIEVSIYRADPEKVRRVLKRLPRAGALEFRIVANERDHKSIIERAFASDKERVLDKNGELLAWWISVQAGEEESFARADDIPTRKVQYDGEPRMEILVVNDPYEVTGRYMQQCSKGTDKTGRWCIRFTLNRAGSRRFGRLTSENLPDKKHDFRRRLGIILDGRLYAAPFIAATIHDSAEIAGKFTEEEVEDLVDILNAGSLPAAIRKVEKRATPKQPEKKAAPSNTVMQPKSKPAPSPRSEDTWTLSVFAHDAVEDKNTPVKKFENADENLIKKQFAAFDWTDPDLQPTFTLVRTGPDGSTDTFRVYRDPGASGGDIRIYWNCPEFEGQSVAIDSPETALDLLLKHRKQSPGLKNSLQWEWRLD